MSEQVNQVRLVGRLGSAVVVRELPSGTTLTSFSVIVDRPAREIHGRTKVDTVPCQTTRARIAARLDRLSPGDPVEVHGALRRRFWRAGAGLASATEVDVTRKDVLRVAS